MLYTEGFSMRHYVGFSQIGSHICVLWWVFTVYFVNTTSTLEQVEIHISKNQALQILYLKYHVYKTS